MTAPYGPAEPDTHSHRWMIPNAEPGRTIYLAPCAGCSSVKEINTAHQNLPGEVGLGWVDLAKATRRAAINDVTVKGEWA